MICPATCLRCAQAEAEAQLAALREENVALRETLEAQRTQLERHYAGLHAKMRKEYEQASSAAHSPGSTSMKLRASTALMQHILQQQNSRQQ